VGVTFVIVALAWLTLALLLGAVIGRFIKVGSGDE
jgi:hypothetical protein